MRRHDHHRTAGARRAVRDLYPIERRNPDMDAPRTITGLAAVALIIALAFMLGRCSAPSAAEPAPTPAAVPVYVSHDTARHAAEALEQLAAWIAGTTTTTRRTAAAQSPVPTVTPPPDRWDRLAQCETGGVWSANTGNGYGGGLQFAHGPGWSTWRAFGGTEFTADPWDASREQQIVVAERVLARSGWQAWPGCARKFGWL